MEPDFYELYKDLPVPELVKVARSPWDYLPEAVTIAQRILRERGVSAEEIATEEWKLAQKEMLDAATKKRFSDHFDWFWELFQIDRSREPVEKWYGLFVVFYALYYVYNFYQGVRLVMFYFRCVDCRGMERPVFWELGFQLYATLALLWMLKQKPIGWALLCIQAIVLNCVILAKCFGFYMHHLYYMPTLMMLYILPFIANTTILTFLFRPYIVEVFRIDKKIRDRTLLAAVGVALVGMVFFSA
jgi:hypothetical protein